jgi:protein-disulfide isomerase
MPDYSLHIHDDEAQLGNPKASNTLIEFGDYECPFSRMGYRYVQRILKDFDEQLRFVFRHFPITKKHPNADRSAEAALFSGKEELFWEMHDLLFDNSLKLTPDKIDEIAASIGLDMFRFRMAMQNRTFKFRVQQDYRSGIKHGVNDTPTFFLNEQKYTGALDLKELKAFIEHSLTS